MSRIRTHWMLAIGASMVLVLAACSGGAGDDETADADQEVAEASGDDGDDGQVESDSPSTTDEQPSGDNVLTIGAAISESGNYSIEGEQVRRGYDLWADWVNTEYGGIDVGGEPYQVEMIYYDDESDPETATRLVERLISEDEVDFVFGPYSSGLTIAVSSITERSNKILFAGAGAANSVFDRGFKNLFGPLTLTAEYTRSGLTELAEKGAKTIGIVHMNDAPMTDIMTGASALAEDLGMEVVAVQAVPADATDITGAMTQVANADPDVFLGAGHTVMGILFTRTMRDLGWAPKYPLLIQAPSEPTFVEELGAETVEGILGPTQWHKSADWSGEWMGSAQDYYDRFVEAYDEEPSYLPAGASAAAVSLQIAIEEVGSLETDAIEQALRDMDVDTFFGPINYSAEDDESGLMGANTTRPMLTIQLKDGEQIVVAPPDAATAPIDEFVPWSDR